MNGVGENTFDAPSVVAGVIFMSPIRTTTSFTSLPKDAMLIITSSIEISGRPVENSLRTSSEIPYFAKSHFSGQQFENYAISKKKWCTDF